MAIDYNRKPKRPATHFGCYNIGYLPHFDAGEIPQFITCRLHDSLPAVANRALRRKGQFWQHESFDSYIRNEKHFHSVIDYIEMNPVKAGLCSSPEEGLFGSANYRARTSRDACPPVK